MIFKGRFEMEERVNVSELEWKEVPELGSSTANGSAPHGEEAGKLSLVTYTYMTNETIN